MIVNYKINFSNEIIIFKQYLSTKKIKSLLKILILITLSIFFLNNEIFSKYFYEKYKVKELEIRNNLKLGSPSQNEFHIDNTVSIFFKNKEDDFFNEVDAIIYFENQFISSKKVEIELSKSNFNLVFYDGERLILNENEKSKTVFDKFIYTLENKKYEELLMDKDHYNTKELISHDNKEFQNHGHNRIFQYFFLFLVCSISLKIIFYYKKKNNSFVLISIFFLVLFFQILNSYLLYLLNGTQLLDTSNYYLIFIVFLVLFYYLSVKILK